MKRIKYCCFYTLTVILLYMAAGTILEKIYGTDFAQEKVYHSPVFIILWTLAAISGGWYFFSAIHRIKKQVFTILLHIALLIILIGASTTYFTGIQGKIHLRNQESTNYYTDDNEKKHSLPFHITLNKFEILYYEGTRSAKDYISLLTIADDNQTKEVRVSMNRILNYKQYRIYQTSYDADLQGSCFIVTHDPWGIGISYLGYYLLFASLMGILILEKNKFRAMLHHPLLSSKVICLALLFSYPVCAHTQTHQKSSTLPPSTAEAFGNLYIYYNDRIAPLQTFAYDFTKKIYGNKTYKNFTPEQVLTGWLFYYDNWKEEPFIKIKQLSIRKLLGIKEKYARLTDFVSTSGIYKLEDALRSSDRALRQAAEEADEKFRIISMVTTGSMLKIYPYRTQENNLLWASQTDELPGYLPKEDWFFIRQSMNYVHELILKKDYKEVEKILEKTKVYQQKKGGKELPCSSRFTAEKCYNKLQFSKQISLLLLAIGLISLIYRMRQLLKNQQSGGYMLLILRIVVAGSILYLLINITLRGYISLHLPLSNGYETMHFMALCTLAISGILQRKFSLSLPFGCLIAGFAMLISMLGESAPQITLLMPVLQSPLLSIHVMIIMIAYTLLALIMMNGLTCLLLSLVSQDKKQYIDKLTVISRILLYPAIGCLATGIFIGAIWANVSWGRYWGWDPKEVWALITLLIYALPLHTDTLPQFRQSFFFHLFCVVAFLSVLITYFGVNFLLGGMHGYA